MYSVLSLFMTPMPDLDGIFISNLCNLRTSMSIYLVTSYYKVTCCLCVYAMFRSRFSGPYLALRFLIYAGGTATGTATCATCKTSPIQDPNSGVEEKSIVTICYYLLLLSIGYYGLTYIIYLTSDNLTKHLSPPCALQAYYVPASRSWRFWPFLQRISSEYHNNSTVVQLSVNRSL